MDPLIFIVLIHQIATVGGFLKCHLLIRHLLRRGWGIVIIQNLGRSMYHKFKTNVNLDFKDQDPF